MIYAHLPGVENAGLNSAAADAAKKQHLNPQRICCARYLVPFALYCQGAHMLNKRRKKFLAMCDERKMARLLD